MRKIIPEIVLGFFSILGTYLVFISNPAGEEVVNLSIVILSIFYFPFGFIYLNEIPLSKLFHKNTYQKISWLRGIGVTLAGMVFWILIFAILFRIRTLPGTREMSTYGIISGSIVLLVLIQRAITSSNKSFYRRMLIRCSLLFIVGLIAYFSK